ncbi:hypothetical protein MC885_021823 [Smutsia gigantea]|nr:hypothetical protein MC885_021823 [Smutsia gigantea]
MRSARCGGGRAARLRFPSPPRSCGWRAKRTARPRRAGAGCAMRETRAARFRQLPQLALPLLLLFQRALPHGSPGPPQCYGIAPLGDLNCSWEPLGSQGAPSTLHLQSQKYHSNRTWTVAVPPSQSWVTIPREQLTTSDELLVWGAEAGQPLWPPVFVNLETRLKPDAPQLCPNVDFPEDDPLETTIQWEPPVWPPHKVLICQFHYRRCQEMAWTLVEPEVKSIPLAPVEIQNLELATGYEVSGRCRMEKEEDLWSEWSPSLSFQTLPSGPCTIPGSCQSDNNHYGNQKFSQVSQSPVEGTILFAPGHCVRVTYRVWFQVEGRKLTQDGTPCCNSSIPPQAEWAGVSAVNATSWEPLTNLSLACLDPGSAPRNVTVSSIAGSMDLLVAWQQGSGALQEYVVDWAQDGDPLENLNWVRLPPGNLSALLPAPLEGPRLWRLQDDPPGTPAVAWGEVPRHQLRGHLMHYTLCAQSGTRPSVCMNAITHYCSTHRPLSHPQTSPILVAKCALPLPPPDNTLKWKVLPGVLLLWGLLLMGCGMSLATSRRCLHLRYKVLPRWVWEKVPDPANSTSSQPHVEEVPQAQPLRDLPILEVEEMEPGPVTKPPQASAQLDSGYEKHFLPTPEELGLLGPPTPGPRLRPELTPGQESGAHLTDEDMRLREAESLA